MIQMRTWLTVADNSGARKLMCIMPVGGDAGLQAGLGDVITAVGEGSDAGKPGKTGNGCEGRDRAECARNGAARMARYIRFDDNAAVLINDAGEPGGDARVRPGGAASCARRNSPRLFRWLRRFGKR